MKRQEYERKKAELLEALREFKRQECAKAGDLCAKCPEKYGICFATNLKSTICLN